MTAPGTNQLSYWAASTRNTKIPSTINDSFMIKLLMKHFH